MVLPDATPLVAPSNARVTYTSGSASSGGPTPPTASRFSGSSSGELERELLRLNARENEVDSELDALTRERDALRERQSAIEVELAALRSSAARCAAVVDNSVLRGEVANISSSLGWPTPYPYQLDGVCSVLGGKHTAVVWPAGGGKGLMTLLLAAMSPGKVVVVVVPLVALAHQLCGTLVGM